MREELGVEVTGVDVMLPDFATPPQIRSGLVENEALSVYRAFIVDSACPAAGPRRGDGLPVADLAGFDRDCRAGSGLLSPWAVAQVRMLASSQDASADATKATRSPGADATAPWPASRACSLNRSTSWRCCGATEWRTGT